MLFYCNRCGYESKYKHHVQNHLNRKKLCKPIKSNCEPCITMNPTGEIGGMNRENEFKISRIDSENNKNESNLIENVSNNAGGTENFEPSQTQCLKCQKTLSSKDALKRHCQTCKGPRLHKCSSCDNIFSTNSNLHKHMRRCKASHVKQTPQMTEVEQLRAENLFLKAQIESSSIQKSTQKIINNNTTNNTTNNNTINNTNNVTIVLNCFGKESLKHITPQYLKQLIGGPFTSTSEIIKRIHFDVDHPENSNVKIPNKKLPWAEVYSDDKWMMKKKKEVLEGMVDKGFNIIDEAYHSIDPSEISTFQKDRYNVYQKTYKNKQTFRKQLVQDAELVVLNQ